MTQEWYQCDEENYDSGTPPEEQGATEPLTYDDVVNEAIALDESEEAKQGANTQALLEEYRAGAKVADDYWKVWDETGSSNAFGNYLAINRRLSALYAELAALGLSLEEIRG